MLIQANTAKHVKQRATKLQGLEDENAILRDILYSSANPILITSQDVTIVYVNEAWEKLTGYSFAEVEGKNPHLLASNKTPKKVYKAMWAALAKGKSYTTEKVINRRKNGHEYILQTTIKPIIKNGDVMYFVQYQRDITKALHLEDLRKEFLSSAAHELRTPLTVLKLLCQSHISRAEKEGIDTINVDELKLIDKELDRMSGLINDILDSSRIERGKMIMLYEFVNLTTLIKETVEKIRIYAANHTIVIKPLPDELPVIADPKRIEQVLLNLLSNAAKYSPDNAPIYISATCNDHVTISVQDKGIGIPKKKQKKIFNRFFQVKAKGPTGFGLGLYISKEIIRQHKGKIWVTSTVSKGSTFSFSLPVYR